MRVLQALLLSLAVHFLLVLFIQFMPVPAEQKKDIVEFEIKPPSRPQLSQNEKKVLAAEIPENLKVKESEDKLKFLSDKFQRVKEQTQAKINGLTKNRAPTPQAQPQTQTANDTPLRKLDPFATGPGLRPRPQAKNFQAEGGVSTNSGDLDDRIKTGAVTALNTDRYLYYSFFSRATELIYYRWDSAVQAAIPAVSARMAGRGSNDKWTTLVEIWLKPDGEFHSAHVMKESGIPEFDQVATNAFRQARFFPNPPKELVEEDGFIRLKWGLTVYFDPKVLAGK
jgi:TonB family protein